jgi:hypothetical protein
MNDLLHDMRGAQYKAAREAQVQSARLTRLMDQSRLDAGKTHDMLAVIMDMLQVQQEGGAMSSEEKVRGSFQYQSIALRCGGGEIIAAWALIRYVVIATTFP